MEKLRKATKKNKNTSVSLKWSNVIYIHTYYNLKQNIIDKFT